MRNENATFKSKVRSSERKAMMRQPIRGFKKSRYKWCGIKEPNFKRKEKKSNIIFQKARAILLIFWREKLFRHFSVFGNEKKDINMVDCAARGEN